MQQVQTVLGPVAAADLGVTLMHEHLTPADVGVQPACPEGAQAPRPEGFFIAPHDAAFVADRLRRARDQFGLRSVVDCSPSPSRNIRAIREVAERSGLQVVASTGSYKEPRVSAFVHQASVEAVSDFFVSELTEGIEGTGIRAGIIKVGSSMRKITPVEEKVLRAASRAHRRTGAPITTHATVGTMGLEQAQIFQEEGVALERVAIGHSDLNGNAAYHEGILRRGASVGFDTIGKERFVYVRTETAGYHRFEVEQEAYYIPDETRRQTLLELLRRGYAGQVVLSSDLSRGEAVLNRATLGTWGYGYVLGCFVPSLRQAGVAEADLQRMLVDNPRRILAGD